MKELNYGVYKITCNKNNKVYIGETMDFNRRWNEHKSQLKSNKHDNFKLQNDYNKYGEDSFVYEKLQMPDYIHEISKKMKIKIYLLFVEDKFIKEYNEITEVYNIENTLQDILDGKRGMYGKFNNRQNAMFGVFYDELIKYNGEFKINDINKDKNNLRLDEVIYKFVDFLNDDIEHEIILKDENITEMTKHTNLGRQINENIEFNVSSFNKDKFKKKLISKAITENHTIIRNKYKSRFYELYRNGDIKLITE